MKIPELTFPIEEREYLLKNYKAHDVILEYGSGGSTIEAAKQKHSFVMSVESDPVWLEGMKEIILRDYPDKDILLHWVNIGITREWGFPANEDKWKNWHCYPLSIWYDSYFKQPDLVLIDGRFRVGCFFATLFLTKKKVTLLWDDYMDREYYHFVEEYVKPIEIVGRMAKFEIFPTNIKSYDLMKVINFMNLPM